MTTTTVAAPDHAAIKRRQRAMWASGGYAEIGTTPRIAGESLAEAVNPAPGSGVLDTAADHENAGRRFTVLQRFYLNPSLSIGG